MPLKRSKKRLPPKPQIVLGIGASAGGIQALKRFFSKLGDCRGTAILVIQHLDDSGKTLNLKSLRAIADFPVNEIAQGLKIEADQIYAVPPHSSVDLENGVFKITPAKTTAQKLNVIDHAFTSLSRHFGPCTIGVVLSGDASDGSQGILDINAAGGLTLAQDPQTAEHKSMPESAIATGAVDHVLDPEVIAKEVAEYIRYVTSSAKKSPADLKEQILSSLSSICAILQKQTLHDFKHYKTSTLLRRIQRRMQVLQIYSVESYIETLTEKTEEVETLFNELLINVTSFFRDPEAFEALRTEVLQRFVAGGSQPAGRKIRVWIAGCSTGEEAYTMAILLKELVSEMADPPEIQILATDIDPMALNAARKGSYASTIAEHVSPDRLLRFFTKRGGRYHVNKELRELCLFSIHNLINDPPFSQLDLISCRNLIIYLGPHLQKKLFPVFHYALKSSGYLFLGTSESLTSHHELFKSVNSKQRIAQRKATSIKLPSITTSVQNYVNHFKGAEKISPADINLIGQRIALDELPFRYAVINDEGQIVSASAGLDKYVQIAEGPFQNSLLKLAKASLRAGLRTALSEARKERRKATNETCTLRLGEVVERVGIIVQPMPQLGEESGLYWVAFQYLGTVGASETRDDLGESLTSMESLDQLEAELNVLRSELDKTVQDLEASNEELKSSNEELLSMNEELQSANEELESSKEEVQFANEALQRSNVDLENLLAGTRIATLFLDEELKITGFTPEVQNLFHIRRDDVGREIADFKSYAVSMPAFPAWASVKDGDSIECEVDMPDGTIYLRRITPYRDHLKTRAGIVVSFFDITNLRNAERRYRQLADSMPNIVWTANPDGVLDYYNERWYEFTGFTPGQTGDQSWIPILHPDDQKETREAWYAAVKSGQEYEMESRFWDRRNRSYRWFLGRAVPVRNADGAIVKWYGSRVDIHDRVTLEESRRDSERRLVAAELAARKSIELERQNFRNLFKQTPEMVCMLSGPEHTFEFVNEAHIRTLGFDATGMTVRKAQPESVEVHGLLDDVYRSGQTLELREISITLGTSQRYFNLTYAARFDALGAPNGVMILGSEITEAVVSREIVRRSEAQLTDVLESMSDSFFAIDKDWIVRRVNAQHVRNTQIPREKQIDHSLIDLFFGTPELKENKYLAKYRQAMKTRQPISFQEYYEKIDLWTDVRAYPIPDGGLAVFFTNITELKNPSSGCKRCSIPFQFSRACWMLRARSLWSMN